MRFRSAAAVAFLVFWGALACGGDRPDFVITAVTAPGTADSGELIAVDITVANVGLADAAELEVGIYLSDDVTINLLDARLGEWVVTGGLVVSESKANTVQVRIPADTTDGTYYIGAYADYARVIQEEDNGNNTLADTNGIVITYVTRPDLAVTAVTGPATANGGDTITIDSTVENQGDGDSAGFFVGLYLSDDQTFDATDTYLGQWEVTSVLAPTDTDSDPATAVTIPMSVPTGAYFVIAYADHDEAIVELDETNNERDDGGGIDITNPLPNLVVTAVTGPGTANGGDTITVSVTVENQGDLDAAEFNVGIYFSADQAIEPGTDTHLVDWTVTGGIAQGNSATDDTLQVTIPSTTPTGAYFIGAYADDASAIVEDDETDNSDRFGIDITNPQPNLLITAVAGPPAAEARIPITVSVTVENQGDADAAEFRVGIYLSDDQAIDPASDRLLDSWTVSGGLVAQDTVSEDRSVTIPGDVLSGAYFIGAYADDQDVVTEPDETDNGDVDGGGIDVTNLSPEPIEKPVSPFDGGACSAGADVRLRATWFVPLALVGALLGLALGRRGGRSRAASSLSAAAQAGGRRRRPGRAALPALFALALLSVGCACGGSAGLRPDGAPETAAACMPSGAEVLAPALPAFMPGEVRRSPMGARLGVLMPGAAQDEGYSTSAVAGAFWPGRIGKKKGKYGIPFEAGLDFARIDADNGLYDAMLYLARFDVLFSKWPAALKKPDFYLLAGLQAAVAQQDGGDGDVETVPGLDLGVGLNWGGLGWDARLTYSVLMDSGNLGSLLLITGAYSF